MISLQMLTWFNKLPLGVNGDSDSWGLNCAHGFAGRGGDLVGSAGSIIYWLEDTLLLDNLRLAGSRKSNIKIYKNYKKSKIRIYYLSRKINIKLSQILLYSNLYFNLNLSNFFTLQLIFSTIIIHIQLYCDEWRVTTDWHHELLIRLYHLPAWAGWDAVYGHVT